MRGSLKLALSNFDLSSQQLTPLPIDLFDFRGICNPKRWVTEGWWIPKCLPQKPSSTQEPLYLSQIDISDGDGNTNAMSEFDSENDQGAHDGYDPV